MVPVPFKTVCPVTPVTLFIDHCKVAPVVLDVRGTAVVLVPEHILCESGELVMRGLGTVMVKVLTAPVQPSDIGVTLIVAVNGPFVVLVAKKEGRLPLPLAGSPIAGLLLVQL